MPIFTVQGIQAVLLTNGGADRRNSDIKGNKVQTLLNSFHSQSQLIITNTSVVAPTAKSVQMSFVEKHCGLTVSPQDLNHSNANTNTLALPSTDCANADLHMLAQKCGILSQSEGEEQEEEEEEEEGNKLPSPLHHRQPVNLTALQTAHKLALLSLLSYSHAHYNVTVASATSSLPEYLIKFDAGIF